MRVSKYEVTNGHAYGGSIIGRKFSFCPVCALKIDLNKKLELKRIGYSIKDCQLCYKKSIN